MSKIALDAGHSLVTAGKRCMKKLDPKETREWTLNSRIANKLQKLLEAYKCEVLRVDDTTGAKDISLADRVKKANNWGADIYISIHHNAGVNGGAGGGTVVFYYSDKAERATQANSLYNYLVGLTELKGNRAQKVIKKGFYVIKNTKMPSFLIENGFMDSSVDVPLILTEKHADMSAQGLLNFLVKELKLVKKSGTTQSTTASNSTPVSTSFKVKVNVDALNIRAGAGTEYKVTGTIRDKGTYTITKTAKSKDGGTWGHLKSGAGWINISDKYVTRK